MSFDPPASLPRRFPRPMRLLPTVLAILCFVGTAPAADPRVGLHLAYGSPTRNLIDGISPPVVERGKTTRVTFAGTELAPALDLWHSLPPGSLKAVVVESRSDRAVLDITASADAPVGVCGVRLATRDGLTNAHVFLVDDLPAKPLAASLPLPTVVWGTFREGHVDRYRIEVAAGERVSFEVAANRFGKDADPLLTIRDSAGRFVTERDNDPGLYFDCRFEHRFEAAGTYTVEVRDARFHGNEHHHYALRVGRFPAGRVAVPAAVERGFWTEVQLPEVHGAAFPVGVPRHQPPGPFFATFKRPGDHGSTWVPLLPVEGPVTVAEEFDEGREAALAEATSGPAMAGFLFAPTRVNPFLGLDRHARLGRLQATPAVVPGALCGVLRRPGGRQAFLLRLQKGERIFVRGEAKALNSPVDLELVLADRTGRELRRGTEVRDEVTLDFTAPAAGEYALVVRDQLRAGGDASAYRLVVRNTPFPPALTAEVEGITIPQGTYQPVPIAVNRNGFAGPIRLTLLGGPPGLRLTPDEIPEGAASVVCRLEADGSSPVGVHAVQILAECGGDRTLVQTLPQIDKKLVNVDLIPIAPRDDQRRLPPSLADRFAVQVTPPPPFTFELPEAVVTLPRYQKAAIPVATTRAPGFDGPIAFTAKGGQLADKEEGRTRVYAEFPAATPANPRVNGVVVSKILSNVGKVRVEVTATGTHAGRRVSLTRTFDLDLVTAFRVSAEPAKVSLLPGESAKVRVAVGRVKSFDGPVTVRLQPVPGLMLPETVTVPKGKDSVELDIAVSPDAQPGKRNVPLAAAADVDGFEEEARGGPLEVEVRKVEVPKK